MAGLIAACTVSSPAFSKRELIINALVLHYWCLLHVSTNMHTFKKSWQERSISVTTLRNISRMVAGTVATCLTDLEPAALQEGRIEQHFGNIKKHAAGAPTLKDLILGSAKEHARQACLLRDLCAENLPNNFTTQSREPIAGEELPKLGQQALASAIQLQCWITPDLTVSECYDQLVNFWNRSDGAKLFGQCDLADAAADDPLDSDCEDELTPDVVEVTTEGNNLEQPAEASESQDNSVTAIARLQGRAATTEEMDHALDVLADTDRQASELSSDPAEPQMDETAVQEIFAAESSEGPSAATPKTIIELMQQVLKHGGGEFSLGERTAHGTKACLKRIFAMVGPIRRFTRMIRLEENLLSLAILERSRIPLNEHNRRMHELGLARKAAALCQQRISRAEAWSKSQAAFVEKAKLQNRKVNDDDPGLSSPDTYRNGKDLKDPQVLLLQGGQETPAFRLGVALSIFRGSICRKQSSVNAVQVRISKPSADPLPSACTRIIHVAPLTFNSGSGTWVTSCTELPVVLDPVNAVCGELVTTTVHASDTRLHVVLSAAFELLLQQLRDGKLRLPKALSETTGDTVQSSEALHPEQTRTFTCTSFMRREIEATVPSFLCGLREEYDAKNLSFVDGEGKIKIGSKAHSWTDVMASAPGYFLHTCKDLALEIRSLLKKKPIPPQTLPKILNLSWQGARGPEVQLLGAQPAGAAHPERLGS